MNNDKKKIVFFAKQGSETFLGDIISEVSKEFETNRVLIKSGEDLKTIESTIPQADISWFEWCDDITVYASNLATAGEKKIVCRLHSYEAFTVYPIKVSWNNVDKLIFVSQNIQEYVIKKFGIDRHKTAVIPNGVNVDKWSFKQRNPGFKIAYIGYINYKKGPMLLLHTFKAIYDKDNRYELHIAGQFQDPRDSLYFEQMVKEFGLEKNYFFEGWQDELDKWMEDKHYILCTSVLESQNMSVMQAMAKGIKPIVHNFSGARGIYKHEYLWNTINEAVSMITEGCYDSMEYRRFVENNYSLEEQQKKINALLHKVIASEKSTTTFNYKNYWNRRLNSMFNIEGVGYMGAGEMYNKLLYKSRINMLEAILNRAFNNIKDIRVLELGPGTGIFTEYFEDRNIKKYSAIDIAQKSVNKLRSKYKDYNFIEGDISENKNYEGSYDLILAADVLLHITNEKNYKKTIINISQHLNDNGVCILFDPITIINAKSSVPHVIIRDRKYIDKILKDNLLELIEILPVSFFLNYPFDKNIIGEKGKAALEAFNIGISLLSGSSASNNEKRLMGEYLLYKDKLLVYNYNFGLSEKLLIIGRKARTENKGFPLREILNINIIRDSLKTINRVICHSNLKHLEQFKKISGLLDYLEDNINIVIPGKDLLNDTTD